MKQAHFSRYLPIVLTLVILALGAGCSEKPADPLYDNPFDPDGPGGDDPFGLVAIPSNNTVILSWSHPQVAGITGYRVKYSEAGSVFETLATVGATTTTWAHTDTTDIQLIHNGANYYKIQAVNAAGETSLVSRVASSLAWTPPFLAINDGSSSTATRHVDLEIRTSSGDSMWIWTEPPWQSVAMPAEPDSILILPWDLGPATANGETIEVFLLVKTGIALSDTARQDIEVDFTPDLGLVGSPTTIGTRDVELTITGNGILSQRFAATETLLADADWETPATTRSWTFPDILSTQVVWAEFAGDFGYTTITSLSVDADNLNSASFTIDGGDITTERVVRLRSSAVAGQMRFSEEPDFSAVPWTTYIDTCWITLSEAPGPKYVYGQFRNFWTDSAVSRQRVFLIGDALSIGFIEPADGEDIPGDLSLSVTGFAMTSGGTAPESLEIDMGEGEGFQNLTASMEWTTNWTTPIFADNTDVTLRLRAIAGVDTATTAITVTITPPLGGD